MANYHYTLGVIVQDVEKIESAIQRIGEAMRHVSPAAVDALRRNKTQLEKILEFILEQDITANVSLPALLTAHKECLDDCVNAPISTKKSYMGRTRV